ncbi:RteC domain-containing protein, partial [Myroides odoratimimus]|uniref:RteC domain-containing protein n=1 Tax=Myroides odoratimimus TaxID=76832 RepID=UPI00257852BB
MLFSTYYDYKASRIIAHNMLQNYLQEKVNSSITKNTRLLQFSETLVWSGIHPSNDIFHNLMKDSKFVSNNKEMS